MKLHYVALDVRRQSRITRRSPPRDAVGLTACRRRHRPMPYSAENGEPRSIRGKASLRCKLNDQSDEQPKSAGATCAFQRRRLGAVTGWKIEIK